MEFRQLQLEVRHHTTGRAGVWAGAERGGSEKPVLPHVHSLDSISALHLSPGLWQLVTLQACFLQRLFWKERIGVLGKPLEAFLEEVGREEE